MLIRSCLVALTGLSLSYFAFAAPGNPERLPSQIDPNISPAGFELSRADLVSRYPDIEEGSQQVENKKIVCPFLRMLERAGLFNPELETQSTLTVGIIKIATYAREFGCVVAGCGGVAAAVSAGQVTELASTPGKVNVEALHKALGISHECGLTFAKGGSVVDDATRDSTLAALKERSDTLGRLTFDDLEAVKLSICEAQDVKISAPGRVEIGLIYSFLGGNERGFIDYDDVVRFFHAELPKTLGRPGIATH
ncbi:MAG: hypothetical protein EOP10_15705 [Proteobacteria bacterium]|nr:MAG: hypothetical protein EOP10_15705 [Pseudomonadota bacterium]